MKEKHEAIIKKFADAELLDAYNSLLQMNANAAKGVLDIVIYAIKKSKTILFKDKLRIIANFLAYKYYSFLDSSRKNEDMDNMFKNVKTFLKDFKATLSNFSELLEAKEYTEMEVYDLYLYYFTLLTIHNNIFDGFDAELRRESLESSSSIMIDIPYDGTIEENINDFKEVSELIRELKKEDN